MAFELSVPAYPNGGPIPRKYTGEGANVSPEVSWSGAPAQAQSYTLIMDDPDAPAGTWNHWLLYDIPPSVSRLAEGETRLPGLSGRNDFGRPGYGGPMPPRGHGPHRYFLRLMTLDIPSLGLPPGARRADIDRATRGHILAEASHMGVYQRS